MSDDQTPPEPTEVLLSAVAVPPRSLRDRLDRAVPVAGTALALLGIGLIIGPGPYHKTDFNLSGVQLTPAAGDLPADAGQVPTAPPPRERDPTRPPLPQDE